ncbi:hypothetical protein PBY51_019395 [Eleginops maclovinus]|uniref:Uncharacterized protein n=1 Tax=Eleginops maclovinus TaxID=56733 RepID=A0AAN8ATD8_ELEMC|nr:hypothetical protein PBY51_019395 [Eleginops maclovinus]
MSKQKTVFVSSGLRDRKRDRQREAAKGNTEWVVRQRCSERLDPNSLEKVQDEPPVICLTAGWKVAHSGGQGEMPHMEPAVDG